MKVFQTFGGNSPIVELTRGGGVPMPRPSQQIQSTETFWNTNAAPEDITIWQGVKYVNNEYLFCGTSGASGVIYLGSPECSNPNAFQNMQYSSTIGTIVTLTSTYGCDYDYTTSQYRFVGCYRTSLQSPPANYGFLYVGDIKGGLTTASNYLTIQKSPSNVTTFVHSVMGNCAVLNTDNPGQQGGLVLQAKAYVYNLTTQNYTEIKFPKSLTTTAYGIWWNGNNSYTITGGFSGSNTNITDIYENGIPIPYGSAYVVDYNSVTGIFSNWTRLYLQTAISHCEGISSYFNESNTYTLSIDYVTNSQMQGHIVKVLRTSNGFQITNDVILTPPSGIASANSVANNIICGFIVTNQSSSPFQCRITF